MGQKIANMQRSLNWNSMGWNSNLHNAYILFSSSYLHLKKNIQKKLLITFNLLLYIYCNQLVLWNQVLKMASFHFNFFSNVCVRIMIITLQYEHFWFQKQQLLIYVLPKIAHDYLHWVLPAMRVPYLLNLQFWKNPKVLQTFLEKNWWKIFQLF